MCQPQPQGYSLWALGTEEFASLVSPTQEGSRVVHVCLHRGFCFIIMINRGSRVCSWRDVWGGE